MKNINSINIFKIICSILVVSIHTPPFSSCSDVLNFYWTRVVAQIAVPFFYAASGYFLFRGMCVAGGKIQRTVENRRRVLHTWKRIVILYLAWSGVYLFWQIPYWQSIGWVGMQAGKDYIFSLVLHGSYYHFWYFVCFIYAVPVLYFLLRHVGMRVTAVIAVALYGIKCLVYSYDWLPVPGLQTVAAFYTQVDGLTDAVCLALPFLMVGVVCARGWDERRLTARKRNVGLCISAALLVAEASTLYFSGLAEQYSYIFFTLPLCFFLFSAVRHWNLSGHEALFYYSRKISTVVYCVHPLLLNVWSCAPCFAGWNSFAQYGTILASSLLFSILLLYLQRLRGFGWLRVFH